MEYTKQHAAPLALIQEESAEDLETHNVVSLFAPVFVRLHRPTQSDVDVVQEILSPLVRRPPACPTDISGQVCGFCDEIHLSLLHWLPPRRPLEFRWAFSWVMCARSDSVDMNSQLRHALVLLPIIFCC